MKTSIFIRILLATLLPVFLVFLIVLGTARNVVYLDGATYSREFGRMASKQISEQTAIKLENASAMQNDVGQKLAAIDFSQPEARRTADGLLSLLISSNHDIYSAWFAFEPGVFSNNRRYYKTLLRNNNEIIEIFDMSDRQLDNPLTSLWYNVPLSTGEVYANIGDYYDYGLGEGAIHHFSMTYPVITDDGRIIGCIGLDIRYEDLFPFKSLIEGEARKIMLISTDGAIMFSSEPSDIGGNVRICGFSEPDEVIKALKDRSVWLEEIASPAGEILQACLYPINIDHVGQTVYLYRDTLSNNLYSSSSMEVIVVTGLIGLTLLAFCVFFSTRGIVRHVKRITDSFYLVANDSAEITLKGEHIPTYRTNVIELDTLQSALISMMVQLRRVHGLRLKAVEAEVEKEKLLAASQAKTNFFATMSHEIRTPMNAVLGLSEILLHEGNLTPKQEKYIRDIKISSDALLNVINDILDISKLETQNMELHPEHYNFRMLIDNISSLATQLASSAGLKFIFESEGEFPPCLYGDGARLRQILLNLIGNAVKFTKEGYVKLNISSQNDEMCFSVTDTGIGIKRGEIDGIFEAFKRIDTRRNREVSGAGLGLSISKSLVELMGGTLSAKSIVGEGSTFSITVPLVPGDVEKLPRVKTGIASRYSDSLRILIVDDNEINLNVSFSLFRAIYGIHCDTAISGRAAIERVKETDYDIIFMDHMMPEFDGVDTTHHIRKLGGKYLDIPIIALTANAVTGTKKELLEGGMSDFLPKPIQSDSLKDILDRWVPKQKRLPDAAPNPKEGVVQPAEPTALPDPDIKGLLRAGGVDLLTGLENIGFDEAMYAKSMRLLSDAIPLMISQCREFLEQGSTHEFLIRVHGMAGSLASIGATALSKDAAKLERALAENGIEGCGPRWKNLIERLEQLREVIDRTLPCMIQAGKSADTLPVSDALFEEQLRNLRRALDSHDYESINSQFQAALSAAEQPEINQDLSQLKLLIDSFDYKGASALIGEQLAADQTVVNPPCPADLQGWDGNTEGDV